MPPSSSPTTSTADFDLIPAATTVTSDPLEDTDDSGLLMGQEDTILEDSSTVELIENYREPIPERRIQNHEAWSLFSTEQYEKLVELFGSKFNSFKGRSDRFIVPREDGIGLIYTASGHIMLGISRSAQKRIDALLEQGFQRGMLLDRDHIHVSSGDIKIPVDRLEEYLNMVVDMRKATNEKVSSLVS